MFWANSSDATTPQIYQTRRHTSYYQTISAGAFQPRNLPELKRNLWSQVGFALPQDVSHSMGNMCTTLRLFVYQPGHSGSLLVTSFSSNQKSLNSLRRNLRRSLRGFVESFFCKKPQIAEKSSNRCSSRQVRLENKYRTNKFSVASFHAACCVPLNILPEGILSGLKG